jgi:hypothetical protein
MLVPNAKFSFWPDDNRHVTWDDESVEYIKRDGWCIAWKKANAQPCPSLEDLLAIKKEEIELDLDKKKKESMIKNYANDLGMIACYVIEKKSNPALTFSDYIDDLKVKQNAIIADNVISI